jgi:hypothetical protein
LGFALLLKFFEIDARFPRQASEVPTAAVSYVAGQVSVPADDFADYAWSGRTIEYHRSQIRSALGFREATRDDEERLAAWLAQEVCPVELREERLRRALLARCRAERIEPPGRVERILGAAEASFERQFCTQIAGRLSEETAGRLEQLVAEDVGDRGFLIDLKADPGPLGLETLVNEIDKLERVRALGLAPDLFADTSEKLVAAWRSRAAKMEPSRLRSSGRPARLTMLAALCWVRTTEITDSLVDLLIALVHKINARAERKVEGELIRDLKRVHGKGGFFSESPMRRSPRWLDGNVESSATSTRPRWSPWCARRRRASGRSAATSISPRPRSANGCSTPTWTGASATASNHGRMRGTIPTAATGSGAPRRNARS